MSEELFKLSRPRFTVLASGSRGNSFLLQAGGSAVLVDAGLSASRIIERMRNVGCGPEHLAAVIVTHEHQDHASGLKVLGGRCSCPVYCNSPTELALKCRWPDWNRATIFQTGDEIVLGGDIRVRTFPVPHDAEEPVGLILEYAEHKIALLTDLGFASSLVQERVRDVDVLVLETNYDDALLRADTKRPWSVKQRIMARHGHLSNQAAAELLRGVAGPRLKHVFMAHLSEDCNRPHLAEALLRESLRSLGLDRVCIHATTVDAGAPTLVL